MFNLVKNKIEYLRQHWFVKNVAFYQVGDFTANAAQALIGVFIVRLLGAENYGIYALAFSLSGFVSIFLGLGARDATTIVLSESYAQNDRNRAKEVLGFLVKMTFIMGIISLIGAFLTPWLGKIFYHNDKVGLYASILILATIVASTIFGFTIMALMITRRIKAVTILGALAQFFQSGLALVFVVLGFGVFGAVSGYLAGSIAVSIIATILWQGIHTKYPIFPSIKNLIRSGFGAPIKKYFGFSFWISADRNLANLYNILPIMLTGIFVTAAQVTYFKLAFGYMNLALSMIGPISNLLNVEFPKMRVSEGGPEKLLKNFIRVSLYSLAFSAVLTVGAIIVAPTAFHILYGSDFNASLKYVTGLLFYGALMGIGIAFGPMFRAINKVKLAISINLTTFAIGVPVGLLLIKNFGLWGSVIWTTLLYTSSHAVSFILIIRELKKMRS
ncbi:MAG: oligosaccharide flippase family protein [Candidatus Yanofskybacteria bacterium]|nr:oligosaccharide flippase family protein [Candidatus Yanofskybacteria bacterium]